MNIIEVNNLTRRFKELVAVQDVSFNVAQGEIFGFLGPNGAGKTTTIKMLATLLKPTSGEAKVAGFSVIKDRIAVRKSIGLVFQESTLDEELSAYENLRFHAEFYGVPSSTYKQRSLELLQLVDLAERAKKKVRDFSGGMKRRLEIVRGMLHYPKVLFLDEPTIGLDPQTRATIWQYILKIAKQQGITLFLTTHYLNEAEYCDRIAVIDHGKIVALDSPDKLKERVGGDIITLTTDHNGRSQEFISEHFTKDVRIENDQIVAIVRDGNQILPRLVRELPETVKSIELKQPSLDDVFLKLTGSKIRDEAPSAAERSKRFLRARGFKR
ncbi:MAG: ABC transporter ATP-binding protein [Candidatus Kerfeldbacteria bacterium CG_4_10_14_0_8_um_filter_42_10]|uniref:ABC transporter ATP-binding protein n=1 Tax=Candidatus Kerfeldbacteria bacterium CG_4_10_14_0_8_um_filter_42_10 TaxID=2014248 RepID=A0A2M7RFP5_9BACT|nr:MAG: ABC transporter ATP-binding protein [Candidatus Kerfeldbacteria bacterium CG_4_10_14_0_8_um_filter_42_10]